MKKLALLTLVLLSFTNVFAMSESKTKCEDSVQVSAYQEKLKSGDSEKKVEEVKGGTQDKG